MSLRVHDDWSTPTFLEPPLAETTGPFPQREFLQTWWEMRGRGTVMLADSGKTMLPLFGVDGVVRFMGEADLCDYHSPLGTDVDEVTAALAAQLPTDYRLSFDSLPEEAAAPIAAGLQAAGLAVEVAEHELAAILQLPPSFEGWLATLSKKQRHEVRRKVRRFTSEMGTPRLESGTRADLATFATMHRQAAGKKGSFMDAAMVHWFGALMDHAHARIDLLTGDAGVPLAAGIGFEDATAYYLYNSAYEPAASHVSPGVILLTELVARAVSRGREVFDFLKGDEPYKFKLGARPRPLYRVTAVIGVGP